MRNATGHAGKIQRRLIWAGISMAFMQETPDGAREQWRSVADKLRDEYMQLEVDDGASQGRWGKSRRAIGYVLRRLALHLSFIAPSVGFVVSGLFGKTGVRHRRISAFADPSAEPNNFGLWEARGLIHAQSPVKTMGKVASPGHPQGGL